MPFLTEKMLENGTAYGDSGRMPAWTSPRPAAPFLMS